MGLKCTLRDTCLSIDNEGDAHWSKDQSAANIGSSTRAFQALHVRKYHCPLAMLPQPCPQESLDRGAGPQSKSSFILLLCYVLFLDVFGIETFRFLISPNALFCSIPTIGASGFFQQLMLLQVSCWNGSISWTDHSK